MGDNAGGTSGNGSSASEGGTSSGINAESIEKLVNEAVSKAIGARLKRLNLEDQITAAVDKHLEKIASETAPNQQIDASKQAAPVNGGEETQRLSLKALNEQIANLTKGIEAERKRSAEAEAKARDIRRTSSVESAFAKHLGADSPHLKPYVNMYQAQFEDRDGVIGRKSVGEYGDEKFVPLDDAIGELFKGELKHLVQTNKAAAMPANGWRGAVGQPMQQQAQGQQRANPLLMEIAQGLNDTRPEAAQILANDATKLGPVTHK